MLNKSFSTSNLYVCMSVISVLCFEYTKVFLLCQTARGIEWASMVLVMAASKVVLVRLKLEDFCYLFLIKSYGGNNNKKVGQGFTYTRFACCIDVSLSVLIDD